MRTQNAYENVIVHDVFDFARRECGTIASQLVSVTYHAANMAFVIPSEVEGFRSVTARLLRGIPRLRFAPLGMTQLI